MVNREVSLEYIHKIYSIELQGLYTYFLHIVIEAR